MTTQVQSRSVARPSELAEKALAGENACPTWVRKPLENRGGAGGLACVPHSQRAFSASSSGCGGTLKRASPRHRKGDAILEGALVILVFVNILIGVFDLAQVLFIRQTFVSRARSAARYGALTNAAEAEIRNVVLYSSPTAPEGAPSGPFGLTAGMVSVSKYDLATSAQRVVVTISGYPYRFFTPWIAGTFNGRNITASAPLETP